MGGAFLLPRTTFASTEADGANCSGDRSTSTLNGQRVCLLSHIVLNTDILINGQSANTIKIGPTDNIVFTVQVKLVSPPDLNASTGLGGNPATYRGDYIYVPGATFNIGLAGFGVTVVPQNTTNYCGTVNGYAKCQSAGNTTQGATFAGSMGPFDSVTEQSTLTNYKAGDVVYSHQFTITPSSFNQLGINNNNSAGAYGINEIIAYPDVALNFRVTADDWSTFQAGGKSFFVQLYPTEQALQSDASTAPPACSGSSDFGTSTVPSCVPSNGSNTAGGNNIKDSSAATGILAFVNEIIGIILGFVQEVVYAIFFWLIAPLIQAMLSIHTYTDTFVAVIYPGWIIVRNICNIFFIVALIVIAMATLLRVESYQFRHLLVQLILAALLVNFSLVISQAILGLADTIQAQFLPANVTVIRSLAGSLMVQNYRDVFFNNFSVANVGTFPTTVQAFFWVALSLGSAAVFCAIAIYLVIRIVALWILLLISPIAYAAGVLPATAKYRSEWWQNFLKYAFFTPIMAFFLNITAVIAHNFQNTPVLSTIGDANLQASLGDSNVATFVFKVASNILLLVFLFAALKVAEVAGVMGAGTITGFAQKGIFTPFAGAGWLAGRGVGRASRWYNEKTAHMVEGRKVSLGRRIGFALLNPKAVVKGWQQRSDELTHAAQGEAEAVGLMVVEQTMAKGKAFNRKMVAERAHDAEFVKNYSELTREEGFDTAYDVATMKNDMEGRAAKRAIIQANMSNAWIDDIIMEADENGRGKELIQLMKNLKSKYKITDDDFDVKDEVEYERDSTGAIARDLDGQKKIKKDVDGNPVKTGRQIKRLKYNTKVRRAMYLAMFGEHLTKDASGHEHVAVADQSAAKLLADMGDEYGKKTNHSEYMMDQLYSPTANNGEGGFDFYNLEYADKTEDGFSVVNGYATGGKYKGQLILKTDEGTEHARKELAKLSSRQQAQVAHHAIMDLGNGKLNKEMFQVVSKAFTENPGWTQERTANFLLTGHDDYSVIKRLTTKLSQGAALEVGKDIDEASYHRIMDMASVSQEALGSVVLRFINKSGPAGADYLKKNGFKIKVGNEVKQIISPQAPPPTPTGGS